MFLPWINELLIDDSKSDEPNLHKDEQADIKAKEWAEMCWDEMADAENSLKAIISDLKTFEQKFDDNYYHSEKPAMSDQWDKLNAMLAEFKNELVFSQKNICDYYR